MKIKPRSKKALSEAKLLFAGIIVGICCMTVFAAVAPAKDAKGGAPDMVRQVAPAMVRQVAPAKDAKGGIISNGAFHQLLHIIFGL